ncbi:MAG TPA: SDR family NAD(P)-dependent oxidoreductase, partial [Kofleriaceae bacterium]
MAKTALITGGNRGIGQQVARVLASDGWDVLIGARDRAKGDAAAARLRKDTGGRLRGVAIDVTDEASIATAIQKLRDGAIELAALVNNAGVYGA